MLLICAGRAALTDIWSARVDAHVQQPWLAGGVSARLLTALMSGAMNAHLLLLRKALSIINYCCGIQIYMYNGN